MPFNIIPCEGLDLVRFGSSHFHDRVIALLDHAQLH
jgi:hypothetical protein